MLSVSAAHSRPVPLAGSEASHQIGVEKEQPGGAAFRGCPRGSMFNFTVFSN